MSSDHPSPNVGTELLFENDRLRVWDLVLEPGQASERHRHEADYLFVVLTPGRFDVIRENGEQETSACDDGLVEYRAVGSGIVHTLRNSGQQTYREILVELRGPSVAASPQEPRDNGRYRDPNGAPADASGSGGHPSPAGGEAPSLSVGITTRIGTELLFENDRLRVWDMVLQPGEESPLHRHEHDYVFVYVTPSRITAFVEDQEPRTFDFDDGFVQYTDIGQGTTHKIRNDGEQVHRQILVELKGPSRAASIQQPETNGRVVGERYERLFPRS